MYVIKLSKQTILVFIYYNLEIETKKFDYN